MTDVEVASVPNAGARHYFVLDVMRGLASISVLIWHYQHLFQAETGRWLEGYDRSYQPLYQYLSLFYTQGGQGVQFFYLLSGAVFAHVYAESLASGATTGREFAIRRIARLYPLHLLTLMLVLVLQVLYVGKVGRSFIYPYNDLKHFVLQLPMISYWGFQEGHSFNAPIWSVSMELVSYIVFFVVIKLIRPRSHWSRLAVAGCICATLLAFTKLGFGSKMGYLMAQAVFCFFLGHALFSLSMLVSRKQVLLILGLLAPIAVIATIERHGAVFRTLIPHGLLFPSMLLAGIAIEPYVGKIVSRAKWIGDISYSTYLIHFPVQLLVAVLCAYWIDLNFYRVDVFLTINASILLLAYLTFRYFERPAQAMVLRRWLGRASRDGGRGPAGLLQERSHPGEGIAPPSLGAP